MNQDGADYPLCRCRFHQRRNLGAPTPLFCRRFQFSLSTLYTMSAYLSSGVQIFYFLVIYMATSKKQLAYSKKYINAKLEGVTFRVPKGQRAVIQDHAKKMGESTNAFLKRAVAETIERDNQK